MSLNSNAIISVDELMSSFGLGRLDFKVACFSLYNSSSDATTATVTKSGNVLTLIVTGGTNAHNTSFTLTATANDTVGELITAIEALSKGWVCNRNCSSSFVTTDLYNIAATSALASTLELSLYGFNGLLFEELINSASEFIESYCSRKFVSATYTEYYNGGNTNKLLLNQYPVTTLTSVQYWDYQSQGIIESYTEHTDYELYSNDGYLYKVSGWSKGTKNYKVVYVAGYSTSTMPSDLKNACKEICKYLYNLRDKQGLSSETVDVRTLSYDKTLNVGIPKNILAMLDQYVRMDLGTDNN